jgi:hypothetical protein
VAGELGELVVAAKLRERGVVGVVDERVGEVEVAGGGVPVLDTDSPETTASVWVDKHLLSI